MNNGDTSSIVPTPEEVAALSVSKSSEAPVKESLDEKKILEEAAKVFALDTTSPASFMGDVDQNNFIVQDEVPSDTAIEGEVQYHTVSGGPETVNEIKKKNGVIPGLESASPPLGIGLPEQSSKESLVPSARPTASSLIIGICFKLLFIGNAILFAVVFGLPVLLEYLAAQSYVILRDGIYTIGNINFPISLIQNLSHDIPQVVVISGVLIVTALIADVFTGSTPKFYIRFVVFLILAAIVFGTEYYLLQFGVNLFSPLYEMVRAQLVFLQ